jgi:hypothetical protein
MLLPIAILAALRSFGPLAKDAPPKSDRSALVRFAVVAVALAAIARVVAPQLPANT